MVDDSNPEYLNDNADVGNVVPMRLLKATPAELLEYPKLSMANVKGLARSKSILRVVIDEITRTRREPPLPGILMYGPPNCGKTYLCRVLAGELRAALLPIDCVELASSGASGARIVLDALRIAERNFPCVVLFDEIDKLHLEESEISESDRRSTVGAIAEVLDQAANETDNLFLVVATATNPWHVPAELVSKARLGEILLVLPPDAPARAAILRANLRDLSLNDDIDIDWLAAHTDGYSGTDLERLCEVAYEIARDNLRDQPTMADLKSAQTHTYSNAAVWLDRAAHQAMLSAHTGLYDDLLDYLNARKR